MRQRDGARGEVAMRAAVLSALVLCGCATAPLHYTRPGGSDEEMQRTLAGCKVKQAMSPNPASPATAAITDNCMRAEGWVRE